MEVKAIPDTGAYIIGESPFWLEREQALLFVDIPAGYIYKYYTKTGRVQKLKPGLWF